MQLHKPLFRIGATLLLLLIGLALALFGLHLLGRINIWQLPILPIVVFLGFGGLACLTLHFGLSLRHTSRPQRSLFKPRLVTLLAIVLIGLNGPAYLLAHHMTHVPARVAHSNQLSERSTPATRGLSYSTQRLTLSPDTWLETWWVPSNNAKGTVILFHGNRGAKHTQLLGPAQTFHALGYNSLLVDFQGAGGSSGSTTTVGIKEAKGVAGK